MSQHSERVVLEPAALDARQVRSRDALRQAMLDMLESSPLDQLSIRDIARAAGVGHATFYRHYATKEALLEDVAADEIRQLVDMCVPLLGAGSYAACLALCEHVNRRRALWTTLLTGGAAATMKAELLRISQRMAAGRTASLSWLPADLQVILIVSSIVELLAWWLRQPKPLPAREAAAILDRVVISPTLSGGEFSQGG